MIALTGVQGSAMSSGLIFAVHCSVLAIFVGCCSQFILLGRWEMFAQNWRSPSPQNSVFESIFFGFAISLLGITGFETSANYIEEQGPSVFQKNLNNIWLLVTFFNPVIAFLGMGLLPYPPAEDEFIVNLDAVLVLSGAVLTSFVGVQGLVLRMALDDLLPSMLARKNKRFGSYHWTVISFAMVGISLYLVSNGNLSTLAGVYTISFVTLMMLFACGHLVLKARRPRLPRPYATSPVVSVLAALGTGFGLVGIIVLKPSMVYVALAYLSAVLLLCALCQYRFRLYLVLLKLIQLFGCLCCIRCCNGVETFLVHKTQEWKAQRIVCLVKRNGLAQMTAMLRYVTSNEVRCRVTFVCFSPSVKALEEVETDESVSIAADKGSLSDDEEVHNVLSILAEDFPSVSLDYLQFPGQLPKTRYCSAAGICIAP
eukprot:CAMPEP_0175120398 /NCGR_PEP_ID=MMETSP0087-20121206/601_1 /TAXON_ID=136419 /ORGANISM="Unknown Unknown, Strain D1" /LENGTH=426 /DNA_ID=CAMNT_0016401845 /DNA_START=149 /DNA_END=1431 /DNA_ORIENTATION=-